MFIIPNRKKVEAAPVPAGRLLHGVRRNDTLGDRDGVEVAVDEIQIEDALSAGTKGADGAW